jgi:hypothetical protein
VSEAQQALWQIAHLLERYGILTEATDDLIEQSKKMLIQWSAYQSCEDQWSIAQVLTVLSIFVPLERTVCYDAECIYDDGDYASVVQQFADATGGEWSPLQLASVRRYAESGGGYDRITFDFREMHVMWQFNADGSDYAFPQFLDLLHEFIQCHLTGEFFELETKDQCASFFYLSKPAVADLRMLMAQISDVFPHFTAFVTSLHSDSSKKGSKNDLSYHDH